jgi:hypothetical protein
LYAVLRVLPDRPVEAEQLIDPVLLGRRGGVNAVPDFGRELFHRLDIVGAQSRDGLGL